METCCHQRFKIMQILLIGAKGLLGRDCQRVLSAHHDVAAFDLPELDITDADTVTKAVSAIRPDLLVNTAAYTQVDKAETDRENAHRVNALGPANLAEACRRSGCCMIHISTDYVFDGNRPVPQPYTESDLPNPKTVYGQTKREGEQAVLTAGIPAAVFRTAWLYGRHGHHFLRTMERLAREQPKRTLQVVNDQHGCPTWSGRLALQIAEWAETFEPGLYHAVGEGHCTWYDLAARFLHRSGIPHRLEPCASAQYPTPAARPLNAILKNKALQQTGRCVMLPWEDDLDAYADRSGLL